MTYGNTFIKVLDKLYFRTGVENAYINAVNCQMCGSVVIIEYYVEADLINPYEFDPYYLNNQKIFHAHFADETTRNIALEMFAVEKRLLHDAEPNDYYWRE